MPRYFYQRLEPALESLLEGARASGETRGDIKAKDLLHAIAHLCQPTPGEAPSTANAWSPSSATACAPSPNSRSRNSTGDRLAGQANLVN